MKTIAERVYIEADFGAIVTLPRFGTRLENRYVFDAAAREVKAMAERGLVEIVDERHTPQLEGGLITDIAFIKLS